MGVRGQMGTWGQGQLGTGVIVSLAGVRAGWAQVSGSAGHRVRIQVSWAQGSGGQGQLGTGVRTS